MPAAAAFAMRRAFTLIELLVVVAIVGTMVTAGVLGLRAGQEAFRIKGATRDIFAAIRNARSVALVKQQPTVVTYSTRVVDDEVMAVVEVAGAQVQTRKNTGKIETLSGAAIGTGAAAVAAEPEGQGEDAIEDMFFSDIKEDVVRGIRIKVLKGDELPEAMAANERPKNKISIFSNVDYLLGKYSEWKDKKKAAEEEERAEEKDAGAPAVREDQEPVSVIWEVNGRTEPHRVWVYKDGAQPTSGLSIKIDRFGAAKIMAGDEE